MSVSRSARVGTRLEAGNAISDPRGCLLIRLNGRIFFGGVGWGSGAFVLFLFMWGRNADDVSTCTKGTLLHV